MPESDHPTSDSPLVPALHDLLDSTVPLASDQWPPDSLPPLEHDRQVLAWLHLHVGALSALRDQLVQ